MLGDSMGDPRMSEGVDHMATVLKVGFLNDKVTFLEKTHRTTRAADEKT